MAGRFEGEASQSRRSQTSCPGSSIYIWVHAVELGLAEQSACCVHVYLYARVPRFCTYFWAPFATLPFQSSSHWAVHVNVSSSAAAAYRLEHRFMLDGHGDHIPIVVPNCPG